MKAIVCHAYGPPDVLRYADIPTPVPAGEEVLVKVRAASVNPADRLFQGTSYAVRLMTGLRKPRDQRIGSDMAGQVESVGSKVTGFKPGDDVFGACRGAFAEYACASARALAIKPPDVTFEQAACIPIAAVTALQGLRDQGKLQPGQHVLINGVAGGVGTFAVQIAKALGAEVTGICGTANVEMVRSIGADRVMDYTLQDFTGGGPVHDLIFDLVGNHSLVACRRVLKPGGTYVGAGVGPRGSVGDFLMRWLAAIAISPLVGQRLTLFIAKMNREDLALIAGLMQAGKITPVIGRRYRLSEVPDAIRYLALGHARGKIVITFED